MQSILKQLNLFLNTFSVGIDNGLFYIKKLKDICILVGENIE
ncbi:MAG: hypothetical protein WCJ19_01715 [bacterium]